MIPRRRPVLRALAAIAVLIVPSAPAAAASDELPEAGPTLDAAVFPSPAGSVTRRIRLDTRLIDVVVEVFNDSDFEAAARPRIASSIRVTLVSADGQPLPDVRATRVKLERVRPPLRIYSSRLIPEAALVFDPFSIGYGARAAAFAPNALLKATVTLVADRQMRTVRVGELRVRPVDLVLPADGGSLIE